MDENEYFTDEDFEVMLPFEVQERRRKDRLSGNIGPEKRISKKNGNQPGINKTEVSGYHWSDITIHAPQSDHKVCTPTFTCKDMKEAFSREVEKMVPENKISIPKEKPEEQGVWLEMI